MFYAIYHFFNIVIDFFAFAKNSILTEIMIFELIKVLLLFSIALLIFVSIVKYFSFE